MLYEISTLPANPVDRVSEAMEVIIQKFGGSSLDGPGRIEQCVRRVLDSCEQGKTVVVVVSAIGRSTDSLLAIARAVARHPDQRELDRLLATGEQTSAALMAIALRAAGLDAISIGPDELGFTTDGVHGDSRLRAVATDQLRRHIEDGRIIVAPGFQGLAGQDAETITTLGRGGSDVTAVALAAALEVKPDHGRCEIHTDVDGVYTADPRLVTDARRLPAVTPERMTQIAAAGAAVLHPRAAMLAREHDVPLLILNTAVSGGGTSVRSDVVENVETARLLSCVLGQSTARFVAQSDAGPGALAHLLEQTTAVGVLPDAIGLNERGRLHLSIRQDHVLRLEPALERTGLRWSRRSDTRTLSLIGPGIASPGPVESIRTVLADLGTAVEACEFQDELIRITLASDHARHALESIHAALCDDLPAPSMLA